MPSCIVATHGDACRERMERLMMQDAVGAEPSKSEQKHVTMRHSQNTWEITMKEKRRSQGTVPTLKSRLIIRPSGKQ